MPKKKNFQKQKIFPPNVLSDNLTWQSPDIDTQKTTNKKKTLDKNDFEKANQCDQKLPKTVLLKTNYEQGAIAKFKKGLVNIMPKMHP